jgi:hypothetical protein
VSAGGFATVADRRYNIQHVQRSAAFLHRKFFERFEFFPHFICGMMMVFWQGATSLQNK